MLGDSRTIHWLFLYLLFWVIYYSSTYFLYAKSISCLTTSWLSACSPRASVRSESETRVAHRSTPGSDRTLPWDQIQQNQFPHSRAHPPVPLSLSTRGILLQFVFPGIDPSRFLLALARAGRGRTYSVVAWRFPSSARAVSCPAPALPSISPSAPVWGGRFCTSVTRWFASSTCALVPLQIYQRFHHQG